MAELIAGNEKTRLVLTGDSALIGRRSEDGSPPPDIDLGGLEGGRTVSRRHAHMFRRDSQWFLRAETTTTNATVVGGRTLSAGEEVALQDGDEIVLGKVPLIFKVGVEAPSPNPDATIVGALEATAELRADGRVFPLAAQEGRQLRLGRHSDDRSYRPDIDLGDLPSGKTVSRRHGLLYHRGDQWFLKVEAEVTNPTLLNGTRLDLGQEVPLQDGNTLQLGRVVVTFHQLKRIPMVGPEQIELIVEPTQLTTDPGHEVRSVVTIINHTGHVEWFRVEIEGIPETWYKILLPDGTEARPAQVRLFHTPAHTATPSPDAVGQLRIYINPPRDCQSWAGVHQFVVSATTQGEPQMRQATSGQLTVTRFEDFKISMEPEAVPRSRGEFTLHLENHGNDLTTATIETIGEGLAITCARQQVQLSNCAKDQIKVDVRVLRRHWLGREREYTFAVKVQAGSDKDQMIGRLTCDPRIPYWLQTLFQRIQPLMVPIIMLLALAGLAFAFLRPPDVKDFKADPARVIVGTPVTLSWTIDRARSVSIDPSSGGEQLQPDNGKLQVAPTATTRYTLTARNLVGISTSRAISVDVLPAPKVPQILSFTASPEHIRKEGETVTLAWKTDGATKVTIDPGDEVKDPQSSGEATVHPSKNNTVYKLTATNEAGEVVATKTIVIDPPQVMSFSASPESVVQGAEVRLRWTAQNFTKLTIKASAGEIVPQKQEVDEPPDATEQIVHPLEDTEYTITASNGGGTDVKTVKVTVAPMQIAFFKAEPSSIARGEQAMLSWNVVGATSITIQPGVGAVGPGQTSILVKPERTTEYTLTATGAANKQLQAKTTVTVGLGAVSVDVFGPPAVTITRGESVTLTYTVQNAQSITLRGTDGTARSLPVGNPTSQGNITVSPSRTTTYTLTAVNDSGSKAASATVTVVAPTPTPASPPAPPKPGG